MASHSHSCRAWAPGTSFCLNSKLNHDIRSMFFRKVGELGTRMHVHPGSQCIQVPVRVAPRLGHPGHISVSGQQFLSRARHHHQHLTQASGSVWERDRRSQTLPMSGARTVPLGPDSCVWSQKASPAPRHPQQCNIFVLPYAIAV